MNAPVSIPARNGTHAMTKQRKPLKKRNIAVPLIKRSEAIAIGKDRSAEAFEHPEVDIRYMTEHMIDDHEWYLTERGDEELMIISNTVPRDNVIRATILSNPDTGSRFELDTPVQRFVGLHRRVMPEDDIIAIRKQKMLRSQSWRV